MSDLHRAALLATARLELDHAHRAAAAAEAGDIRRALQLAIDALGEAGGQAAVLQGLRTAMAELDGGQLAGLGNAIEAARRDLNDAAS